MTTEQKLRKLIRLLVDHGEGGLFRSDFNEELKELYRETSDTAKTEETKPGCEHLKRGWCDGDYRCLRCGELLTAPHEPKTEEIKPDVTTGQDKKTPTQVWGLASRCCGASTYTEGDSVGDEQIICGRCKKITTLVGRYTGEEKPWMPNPGDWYWTIDPDSNEPCALEQNSIPPKGFLALYKLGLIFKTQEEAMAKIVDLLKL